MHGVEHANAPPQPVQELPQVMQQFLETLQQLMQPVLQTVNRVANQPVQQPVMQQMAEVRETEARDKTYDRLRKQGATEFEGTTDPEVAEEWLRETDRVLDRLDCTPEQKLKYVVSLLRKSALDWWDLIPGSRNRPMTLT